MTPEHVGVDWKEYVDSQMEADRAARRTADSEREKAAQALATEREKTAQALAKALSTQIEQGDQALREHIAQQVQQIREALGSAGLLEAQRFEQLDQKINIINAASDAAIEKQEGATERRFEGLNEWRGQSADRERSQAEQIRAAQERSMPREVAEAQFETIRDAINTINSRMDTAVGSDVGRKDAKAGFSQTAQFVIGSLGLLVATLSIVVVIILANAK